MNAQRQHLHFLGIAGIGVSALAQVALERGSIVSGTDPNAAPEANPAIARLAAGGATLYREHRAENLSQDVTLVVASAAIAEDNPEIRAAHARGIRVVSRADFLGELMAAHPGPKIAVSGTHGKTTTTAMIGVLLQEAGLDPTVFVGAEVAQLGANVRVGAPQGPFVAEACEAYDSFLSLRPEIVVLTNIEADHLDHYGNFNQVVQSFRRFLGNVPEGGVLIGCTDDPVLEQLMGEDASSREVLGYGIDSGEHPLRGMTPEGLTLAPTPVFHLMLEGARHEIRLRVPGRHNALNALAAASVGVKLGLSGAQIAAGLNAFCGAERRQEMLGEVIQADGSILVMDDYAHHPTEIRATLEALRNAYPERRLVAIFQPHLYSRTRDFLPDFARELARADALVVTEVYAAREAPIPGVRAADIVNLASRQNPYIPAIFLPDRHDIPGMLAALVRPNDLAVFLGAGDIREQGETFLAQMQTQRRTS